MMFKSTLRSAQLCWSRIMNVGYEWLMIPCCTINLCCASCLSDTTLPSDITLPWSPLSRVTCDTSWQTDAWQPHTLLTRDYHANRVFTPSYQNTDNEPGGFANSAQWTQTTFEGDWNLNLLGRGEYFAQKNVFLKIEALKGAIPSKYPDFFAQSSYRRFFLHIFQRATWCC